MDDTGETDFWRDVPAQDSARWNAAFLTVRQRSGSEFHAPSVGVSSYSAGTTAVSRTPLSCTPSFNDSLLTSRLPARRQAIRASLAW